MGAEPDTGKPQADRSSERRKRRGEDDLRQSTHPDPGSRGSEQLGVALAQPVAAAQHPVELGDRAQTEVAEGRTDGAVRQLLGIKSGSGAEASDDEREGQRVRQLPASNVDPAQGEKPPAQETIEPNPLSTIDQHSGKRDREGGKLNPRVEPADRVVAKAASAPGDDPAQERDEVARSQLLPAPFAARPGQSDRRPSRQPLNEHAQEATDERCGQQHAPSGGIGIGYSIEQFRPVHLHSLRPPPIHYRAVRTSPATTPGQ